MISVKDFVTEGTQIADKIAEILQLEYPTTDVFDINRYQGEQQSCLQLLLPENTEVHPKQTMYKDSEPVHEDKSEFDTTHVDGCLQIRIGFPAVFGLAIAKRHSRVQCLSKSAIHQLVDATDCPSDKISMDPQPVVPLPLLFIGDCVYIDTRNAHAVSMQATTLFLSNLVGNHSRTASMDTHFTDLNLKLNHYYLYMHQGNCRHYIVFEKLFLNTTTLDYPRTLVENPVFFPPQCAVCGLDTARFVSFGDLKLDKDPCLWCQGCHDKFHPNETVAIDINF